jgi:hypothetical protein
VEELWIFPLRKNRNSSRGSQGVLKKELSPGVNEINEKEEILESMGMGRRLY